jgi:hypothetical protein
MRKEVRLLAAHDFRANALAFVARENRFAPFRIMRYARTLT